jgi:hypothetical protein
MDEATARATADTTAWCGRAERTHWVQTRRSIALCIAAAALSACGGSGASLATTGAPAAANAAADTSIASTKTSPPNTTTTGGAGVGTARGDAQISTWIVGPVNGGVIQPAGTTACRAWELFDGSTTAGVGNPVVINPATGLPSAIFFRICNGTYQFVYVGPTTTKGCHTPRVPTSCRVATQIRSRHDDAYGHTSADLPFVDPRHRSMRVWMRRGPRVTAHTAACGAAVRNECLGCK